MDSLNVDGADRRGPNDNIKRRSSRACDQCRKTKGKCERKNGDDVCSGCRLANLECTTNGPSLKRGPPKGYLRAVETHLHEVEAVLGIILTVPDPHLREVLKVIAQDPFAHNTLSRVDKSPFGPSGREMRNTQPQITSSSLDSIYEPKARQSVNPFIVGPSNKWQDHVLSRVLGVLEQGGSRPRVLKREQSGGIVTIPTENWLDQTAPQVPSHVQIPEDGYALNESQNLYSPSASPADGQHLHEGEDSPMGGYSNDYHPFLSAGQYSLPTSAGPSTSQYDPQSSVGSYSHHLAPPPTHSQSRRSGSDSGWSHPHSHTHGHSHHQAGWTALTPVDEHSPSHTPAPRDDMGDSGNNTKQQQAHDQGGLHWGGAAATFNQASGIISSTPSDGVKGPAGMR